MLAEKQRKRNNALHQSLDCLRGTKKFLLSAELRDSNYQGSKKPLLTIVNVLGNMKSKKFVGDKRDVKRSRTEMKNGAPPPGQKSRPKTANIRSSANVKSNFQY